MRAISGPLLSAFTLACALALGAGTADAKCKRMGFLVNDYGKDGPTKDAQDLLEKHVAEWAAQNGVKNYTIGKKDVSCELFLNFIVFDEHTCTASANVCWDEPGAAKPDKTATDKTTPEKKKSAEKKSSPKKAEEKTAEQPPEAPAPIETGTIPPSETPAAAPAAGDDPDAAERAAAAAERAAAAAERAASAAEKAAEAAKSAPEEAPSQLEMPAFGAGKPAEAAPEIPTEPKP